ncbi:probable serine/threonine-protein kinase DDB_G0278845 [Zeugodacus cucurbitae]|nr:probable serine/threonine-protein kinase DDB_G0278845 [Zeugodacus cucurbitae]
MATSTTPTTIMSTTVPAMPLKKAGPPVPPRPSHAGSHAAGLLKTQRSGESVMNAAATAPIQNRVATTPTNTTTGTSMASPTATSSTATLSSSGRVSVGNVNTAEATQHNLQHPIIQKKPTLSSVGAGAGGRTVIYKSPSMSAPKRPEALSPTATNNTTTNRLGPKPPLKLRKAPDIPTMKPKATTPLQNEATTPVEKEGNATKVPVNSVSGKSPVPLPAVTMSATDMSNGGGDVVIVQTSASAVNLSRHHSMGSGSPKSQSQTSSLKDTRLSLGRADFERVGKIQLDQLPTSVQPLPRPRKIVKVPVATLDLDDSTINTGTQSNSSGVSIFRRSKTTLDNFTSRANITTINTGGVANTFLGGKTVELKNNLKNAAERLFSEIMVNQQRHGNDSPVITKHEPALQHQATQHSVAAGGTSVTVVTTGELVNNCTRININTNDGTQDTAGNIENMLKSPEKKTAFHEILISELAAMRDRSSSMENLTSAETPKMFKREQTLLSSPVSEPITKLTTTNSNEATTPITATSKVSLSSNISNNSNNDIVNNKTRQRCNSIEDVDPDTEDVDADNVEDTEDGEEDDMQKHNRNNKLNGVGTPRKRCPSGCSSDSSPYGTERSARIRTSDWIEVGDNGKEVTMTSCHISLEDSGLEDEERLDEMSSLGVGDSWDSVKEAENVKRCRTVKRIMSITDLPPLPKSLSGINKMLGSDSGLISDDADVNMENQNNNHNNISAVSAQSNLDNNVEYQKGDNNNNSNNNNSSTTNSVNNVGKNELNTAKLLESNEMDANNKSKTSPTTTTATAVATTNAKETTTTTASTTAATPAKSGVTTNAAGAGGAVASVTGSTLDTQLAILRKEMYGLRQLDLSLLSQLWALNDSIQEFRTMLESQELEADSYSPHSPTPSSYDSVSSDAEDDANTNNIKKHKSADMNKPKIITTQPKLTQRSNSTTERGCNGNATASQRPSPPKPLDMRPVPRMRSAPPPPPANRKSAAPPRPT